MVLDSFIRESFAPAQPRMRGLFQIRLLRGARLRCDSAGRSYAIQSVGPDSILALALKAAHVGMFAQCLDSAREPSAASHVLERTIVRIQFGEALKRIDDTVGSIEQFQKGHQSWLRRLLLVDRISDCARGAIEYIADGSQYRPLVCLASIAVRFFRRRVQEVQAHGVDGRCAEHHVMGRKPLAHLD
jgi:hypothetical protein